jgi:energy-coupling factor transporter ATP-binding protein EcfA2
VANSNLQTTPLSQAQLALKKMIDKNKISTTNALLVITDFVKEYYVTENEDVYATIEYGDTTKNVNIASKTYEQWLRSQYYILSKGTLSNSILKEVINTISAREAMGSKSKRKTYLRIGQDADSLYIDLMNQQQKVIKINKAGWGIVESKVQFERPVISKPIIPPKNNGDLSKLRNYIPLTGESYKLVLSFIIGCFMPDGPYPILILQGSQGSGKSTLSKLIKLIVDPSQVLIQSAPKNEKDLMIAALNNHLLVYDNLSGISSELSDAICKLSTGAGMTLRSLYTDKDATVFRAKRPQILNGIDYIATRSDLADRSTIVTLPKMSDDQRLDEKTFWNNFYSDLPDILGGICDVLSSILANYDSLRLTKNSRMADYVKWITAGESRLGFQNGEFYRIYEANKNEAAIEALEQDMLANSINELLKEREEISGNATTIIKLLKDYMNKSGMSPRGSWTVTNRLKGAILRIEPILNRANIFYEYKRGNERIHRLYKNA